MVLRFFALIAVLFTFSAAHASTINGTGSLTLNGSGGFAFFGTGLQAGTSSPTLQFSATSAGNFNAIGVAIPPNPPIPPVTLTGSDLVSTTFGEGFIDIVYGASTGSLTADFEQFLVRINGFTGNASSTTISGTTNASITVSAVDLSAVPLPAGLPLLIAGMGAFALVRRRSTKMAQRAA